MYKQRKRKRIKIGITPKRRIVYLSSGALGREQGVILVVFVGLDGVLVVGVVMVIFVAARVNVHLRYPRNETVQWLFNFFN